MQRKKLLIVVGYILFFVMLIGWIIPILLSTIFSTRDAKIAAELEARYGVAFTVQGSAMLSRSEARRSGVSGFLGGRWYQVSPVTEPDIQFQVEEYWHWGFRGFPPVPYVAHTLRESYWQFRLAASLTEFLEKEQIPYETEGVASPSLLSIPLNEENWEETLRKVVLFLHTLTEEPPFSTASAMEKEFINPQIQFPYQDDSCRAELYYYGNLYESVDMDDIIENAQSGISMARSTLERDQNPSPVYLLREEMVGSIHFRYATREELINWFQKTYIDAPIVVAEEPVTEADCVSYPAYLEERPELVFHLQAVRSYVGEHAEFSMTADFDKVYGSFYISQYQSDHPTYYVQVDEDAYHSLGLQVIYETPEELDEAVQELLDVHSYLEQQEYFVRTVDSFIFRSHLCDPVRDRYSLGSGYLSLDEEDDLEAALRSKQKDLMCELAAWCSFFDLHPEWFSPEELDAALSYTQTEDYGGASIYMGTWNIDDSQRGIVGLKFPIVAPDRWSISFAQIYQLLSALGWESLTGSETDFSFAGEDGSTYALSYALWEGEDGMLLSRCTKDGVPMDQTFGPDDGYMSYSLLTEMTGIQFREQSGTTYRGPGPDGTVQLPSGPDDMTE